MSENDLFDPLDDDIPLLRDIVELGEKTNTAQPSTTNLDIPDLTNISEDEFGHYSEKNNDLTSLTSEELTGILYPLVEERVKQHLTTMADVITQDIINEIKNKN